MKRSFTIVAVSMALMGAGCATTTSAQEQHKAEQPSSMFTRARLATRSDGRLLEREPSPPRTPC